MRIQKRLVVWLLETSCEALLLSGLLVVLSRSSGPSQWGFIKDLAFGFFATLLVFMWGSGYLITTAFVRIFWRTDKLWLYSSIVALLFSIHLQIFLFIAGGWTSAERLPIRVAGPCIVFACTYGGGYFLRNPVKQRADAPNGV
jgi:hypothetical protein